MWLDSLKPAMLEDISSEEKFSDDEKGKQKKKQKDNKKDEKSKSGVDNRPLSKLNF